MSRSEDLEDVGYRVKYDDAGNVVGIVGNRGEPSPFVLATTNKLTGGSELSIGSRRVYIGPGDQVRSYISANIDAGKEIKYIVAGDSTRDNTYNGMIAYYTAQLVKAGITVVDNAESGQSGHDWYLNIDQNKLSDAITASGDGTGVVLEYSFGTNDIPTYSDSAAEINLRAGVLAYIAACPNALVLLVEPVYTANTSRNATLSAIYQRMSIDFNLPLINIQSILSTKFTDPRFYYDATHCTKYGSARIVNYILDRILPADLKNFVTLSDGYFSSPSVPVNTATNMAGAVESGYWSSVNGSAQANASWRRLPQIAVSPLFTLTYKSSGNNTYCVFVDSGNAFIKVAVELLENGFKKMIIPENAAYARINLASNGATYDALAETVEVRYEAPLTMTQVNAGVQNRMPKVA